MYPGFLISIIFLDVGSACKISSELLADCKSASELENSLKTTLNEISHQLITIQQQCLFQDRPLCFALQFSGYDVTLHLSNVSIVCLPFLLKNLTIL